MKRLFIDAHRKAKDSSTHNGTDLLDACTVFKPDWTLLGLDVQIPAHNDLIQELDDSYMRSSKFLFDGVKTSKGTPAQLFWGWVGSLNGKILDLLPEDDFVFDVLQAMNNAVYEMGGRVASKALVTEANQEYFSGHRPFIADDIRYAFDPYVDSGMTYAQVKRDFELRLMGEALLTATQYELQNVLALPDETPVGD